MTIEYGDIIVGAGASGAVLAARLSEDPDRSVLLLEAGPDYATAELTPAGVISMRVVGDGAHDWGYTATATPGREVGYPRGRVIGGSSSVNGAAAIRGIPEDYDEWAALGNPAWSWREVLPYFNRLEDDQDERGDFHGAGGPLPVVRWRREELLPVNRAFLQACRSLGYPEAADLNHPDSTGASICAMNRRGDARISTALAYLLGARNRLNLTIRGDCLAGRVLCEGDRAVAVEVECAGLLQRVRGRRITLCAGAIATPAILLRSGIGPAADLATLGIALTRNLPGVGANLMDHQQVGANFGAAAGALPAEAPVMQAVLRYTTPGSDQRNDMQLCIFTYPQSNTIRLSAVLQRVKSRGRITLASADPHAPPRIDLNLASDPEDVLRLAEGLRLMFELAQTPELSPFLDGSVTLDGGDTISIQEAAEQLGSDDARRAIALRAVDQFFHASGTARMGPATDAGAVVDQRCRVHGIPNLCIVDASVMPSLPRANTNLTCIMIGERVADWKRAEQPAAEGPMVC